MFCVLLAYLWLHSSAMQEIFTAEYHEPLNAAKTSSNASLEMLLALYPIHSLVDAGCGDNPWIPPQIVYTGVDIVEGMVPHCLDITKDPLPAADLILCRNILEYFSYRDIFSALQNFQNSGSQYLIVNTQTELEKNQETQTGMRRELNFQISPFFFPEPLAVVPEAEGALAIWRLTDIDPKRREQETFPPITFLTKAIGAHKSHSHQAVANSVIRGLKQVATDYNVDPLCVDAVKAHVVITGDEFAGLQAYEWKKQGRIQRLFIGPNFAPSIQNFFITWPLIDGFLGNSAWYENNLVRFFPTLKNRLCPWFAGIDPEEWKPSGGQKQKKALYYYKSGEVQGDIPALLRKWGYEVLLIRYGSYTPQQFKQALEESAVAIFVSQSETQGLALAEAWSMNVPVFAWNPKTPHEWDGLLWTDTSSCPYLNSMVGQEWQTLEQLEQLLQSFDPSEYQPRRWVLLHMSDKVSVEKLFSYVRGS
ncbi:MAG: class I SAM-dependent methyltransferase [Chlamydiia bacterium]|nr:class I SAM-dependent methyltransferase [Chlamydiia bacterium]